MNNFTAMNEKCRHFLVRCPFVKRKPVPGCLMIDSQFNASKGFQIICDCNNVIISKRWIHCDRQQDILTMFSDIPHISKRFILSSSIQAALICKIVIIGKIPLKTNIHVLACLTNSLWPLFILWIIAVH